MTEEIKPTENLETTEAEVVASESVTDFSNLVLTKKPLKAGEYIATIGRRKTATAQVRLSLSKATTIKVNDKDYTEYFQTTSLQKVVMAPFHKLQLPEEFAVSVIVSGSGIASQADAVRHGISRALTEFAPELRSPLKKSGFLKRDPRAKERRKPGLKKARKSAQWSKR